MNTQPKILFNLVTYQGAKIFPPWLSIIKYFQAQGTEVFIHAGIWAKKIGPVGEVNDFEWLEEKERQELQKEKVETKSAFIFFALKRNWQAWKKTRQILKYNTLDVVYAPSSVLDMALYPYLLKLSGEKIKWVTTLANIVPFTDEGNRLMRFLAWFFFRLSVAMLRKADVVFASTPEIRDYLLKAGFPDSKVVLTGFAVENEMIARAERKEEPATDALFVGRLNETKGIYDMLSALEIIRRKFPDFILAFMGGGDSRTRKEFEAEIRRRGLEKNTRFLGYRSGEEKYAIIKSARSFWFLSKSRSESFGIALLEAVCSGVPAFAYDLPQFRWLYPDGEVDISPLGDYRRVAEKVLQLFEGKNFRNEKGERLLGKYSWEAIARKEYEEIKKLLR